MKQVFTLLLLLFFIRGRAQTNYFPPTNNSTWDTLSPTQLNWCSSSIDSLNNYLQSTKTDAFIILKNGKIVLEKYFGTFTQDSIHYWASAGKSLTAMITGIAQQKGMLNINDSASKYLGTGWTSETPAKEKLITIKHLLTMTGGMNDSPALPCLTTSDNSACLQYLADAGTRWSYHTGAYRKIEDIISSVTGQNYTAATNNLIGNKIGMNGIWVQSVYYSKAREMARFGLLALNKGIWQNDTILKDTAYYRAMINTSQNYNLSYGYLWWLNGKSSAMVPFSQIQYTRKLIPNAPNDLFCALGKNDQKIYVIPSESMVIIRMGSAAYEGETVTVYDSILWNYINKLSDGCVSTGIETFKNTKECKIFPNPATNFISFSGFSNTEIIRYSIVNVYGQVLYNDDTYNHSINISELPAGQYYVHLQNEEMQAIKPFIKN